MKLTHYEALEVLGLENYDAEKLSDAVIRKAYRRLAMKWHPDKNLGREEEVRPTFDRVHAAYTKLLAEDSDEEDADMDDDGASSDEADVAASFFVFMMHKMHGARVHIHVPRPASTYNVPPYTQRSSYVPPTRWTPEMYADEDSDESEADFYFPQEEEREFLRQERLKREARAQQQQAQRAQVARQAAARNAEHDAKVEAARGAEQEARVAAEEVEALRRTISQLPRPTMSSRSETSITLSLARLAKSSGEDKLPKQCVWELELKDQSGGGWRTIHPAPGSLSVTPDCLTPGTKYIFRARAARKCPDGGLEWGKYSEESHYATTGKAPVLASGGSASGSLDAGKRPKKRETAARKSSDRRPQQGSTAGSQELDEEEAQERMQAERQKDAAIKAAQARAAAEYEAEVAQLNAMKLATEARINEKVKKSKQKARKKEEATTVEEAAAAGPAAAQAETEAPERELPPRPPPYRAPPVLRPYTADFSDCFGNVQRTVEHAPPVAGYSQGAAGAPDLGAYGADPGAYGADPGAYWADPGAYGAGMSDAEMAQLVAALDESERTHKEELAARQAMKMTEAAFPSLVSKVSYDDYPTRPVTNHKAAPASPARGPTQQQRQHAPAVHGQMKTPQHSRHSATADVNQQPSQQQKQAPLRSMPRPPPAQQPQLPDPRWSSSGNSPSQSPRKQPPQKPHSLRSALPPGYMPQARPAGHVPQPRRVAQQPMAEQPAMAAGSQHANGVNRHSRGVNLMPGPAPLPRPVAAPAPVKVTPPVRRAYNPMAPIPAHIPGQQARPHPAAAAASASAGLPDILQQLMPRAGA